MGEKGGRNKPSFSVFIIPKYDKRQVDPVRKDTMSFCFFSLSFFSISRLRLNNEIVKYSGLNIYLRAFAFSHIN